MTAKIECPYSPERLREMYWREWLSREDIARHGNTRVLLVW